VTVKANHERRLIDLVRSNGWLMRVLATVHQTGLPDAWVGAGAIRDLVWGQLYGSGFDHRLVRDVDVVYFDRSDLSRERDQQATRILRAAWPDVPWEACNQAAVHTWYARTFGGAPVAPLTSIADAVGTWPETATAVAVQLDPHGAVHVCAPLGLADLLGGVWRRHPRRISLSRSLERLGRQDPARRWPGVRIIPPA
jgi:hypothetical protein